MCVCVQKSVTDARANWGIPKELAEFEWKEPTSTQAGRITVRHPRRRSSSNSRGEVIFDALINDNYSPVAVPFQTKVPLLPNVDILNWVPLVQLAEDERVLKTTLSLRGWVKVAAMADKPRVDASLLPAVGSLYGVSISSFELQFKKPLQLQSPSHREAPALELRS